MDLADEDIAEGGLSAFGILEHYLEPACARKARAAVKRSRVDRRR